MRAFELFEAIDMNQIEKEIRQLLSPIAQYGFSKISGGKIKTIDHVESYLTRIFKKYLNKKSPEIFGDRIVPIKLDVKFYIRSEDEYDFETRAEVSVGTTWDRDQVGVLLQVVLKESLVQEVLNNKKAMQVLLKELIRDLTHEIVHIIQVSRIKNLDKIMYQKPRSYIKNREWEYLSDESEITAYALNLAQVLFDEFNGNIKQIKEYLTNSKYYNKLAKISDVFDSYWDMWKHRNELENAERVWRRFIKKTLWYLDNQFGNNPNESSELNESTVLKGYKIMIYKNGKAISGADQQISFSPTIGNTIRMSGMGIYLGLDRKFVLTYYSDLHDEDEILITFEFDPKDIISGNIHDKEAEVTVRKATIASIEVLP